MNKKHFFSLLVSLTFTSSYSMHRMTAWSSPTTRHIPTALKKHTQFLAHGAQRRTNPQISRDQTEAIKKKLDQNGCDITGELAVRAFSGLCIPYFALVSFGSGCLGACGLKHGATILARRVCDCHKNRDSEFAGFAIISPVWLGLACYTGVALCCSIACTARAPFVISRLLKERTLLKRSLAAAITEAKRL